MRRRVLFGLACLGAGLAGLSLRVRPAPLDLGALLGPLRLLPEPFLWRRWDEALRRDDLPALIAALRALARCRPGRAGLHEDLAWRIAYDLGGRTKDPAARAALVEKALATLAEGRSERPRDAALPALAAFLLTDLTRGERPGGPALARALERRLGRPPLALAQAFVDEARALDPALGGLPALPDFVAAGCVQRAAAALGRGRFAAAAALLARAARVLAPADRARAARLRRLAARAATGRLGAAELAAALKR